MKIIRIPNREESSNISSKDTPSVISEVTPVLMGKEGIALLYVSIELLYENGEITKKEYDSACRSIKNIDNKLK